MSFLDFLEAEHPGRLGLILASSHSIYDLLERNIRHGEFRRAENEAAEETEVNSTWHLQQRVEGSDRSKAAQKSGQADTAAAPNHGHGVEEGAIADEVE